MIRILMPYVCSRPYIYCFCQIFKALRLFPALRLFQTQEYKMNQLTEARLKLAKAQSDLEAAEKQWKSGAEEEAAKIRAR